MRKIIYTIILLLGSALVGNAATVDEILAKVKSATSATHSLEAKFTAEGSTGSTVGTFKMQGRAIRLSMEEMSCWYDGTTLWSYSAATDEVNITEPTVDELLTLNPYVALDGYKKLFNASVLKSKTSGMEAIRFTAKKGVDTGGIKEMVITVASATGYITKVVVVSGDGSSASIKITNYKKGTKLSSSAFKFNKAEVPNSTQINDLR